MLIHRAVQAIGVCLSVCVYGRILALAILTCVGNSPVLSAATLPDSESASAEQRMQQGLSSYQRGDFEHAVLSWTEAARLYEAEQKSEEQSSALIHVAQAYQLLGQYRDALKNLEAALVLAEKSGKERKDQRVTAPLATAKPRCNYPIESQGVSGSWRLMRP